MYQKIKNKYPYKSFDNDKYICVNGDCLDVMKELEENSIDAIVCDPPYGLGKEPNPREVLKSWIEKDFHEIKGSGFMGKKWDAFVPQPIIWKECFRVLKPGGHLLSFAGTRTQDWMGMSLRFAGFEIRDCICWIYSTGFPKSLNISKQLDKIAGKEREIVGKHNQPAKEIYQGGKLSNDVNITIPATEQAKKYEGFGTQLKPALEPIIMCRKPISKKNIALNVLKWGTGGINIDECRIDYNGEKPNIGGRAEHTRGDGYGFKELRNEIAPNNIGRFPSNLILQDCGEVKALFPNNCGGGNHKYHKQTSGNFCHSKEKKTYNTINKEIGYGDKGSASRFFKQIKTKPLIYIPKASKEDRNEGLDELEKSKVNDGRQKENDTAFQRGKTLKTNTNPCVKPTELMRYLIRLITPPNGIVLDPFMGSGSTGKASVKEGFRFIGIDLEEEYYNIACKRIKYELKQPNLF